MKRTLLIAILALSINAFAQTRMPAPVAPKPGLNSLNHFRDKANLQTGINDKIASVMQAVLKDLSMNKDANVQLFDSIFVWEWEQSLTGWMIAGKIIGIEYDANNNLTDHVGKSWNGNTWENYIREHLTYDGNNNMLTLVGKEWDGTNWIDSYQGIYTYDANNNLLSELSKSWNGSAWMNLYLYTFTYDPNDNMTSETDQHWEENEWLNHLKTIYTFDANNNLTIESHLIWLENSWTNGYQLIYTYAENNKLFNLIVQSWIDQEWIDNSQSFYTYDEANNVILMFRQTWDGSTWSNSNQFASTYDTENKLIHELGQNWSGTEWMDSDQNTYSYNDQDSLIKNYNQYWTGSEWLNGSLSLFAYDETSNFKYSQSTKQWEYTGNEVLGGDSIYYYFHTGNAGIDQVSGSGSTIAVYPVPTSGELNIVSKNDIRSIEIYNLTGEKIYSGQFPGHPFSVRIDLTRFTKGTYMIKLDNGSTIIARKIILQ